MANIKFKRKLKSSSICQRNKFVKRAAQAQERFDSIHSEKNQNIKEIINHILKQDQCKKKEEVKKFKDL